LNALLNLGRIRAVNYSQRSRRLPRAADSARDRLGISLRFLPYVGPWQAAVLPILISLAVSDGWMQPILVA